MRMSTRNDLLLLSKKIVEEFDVEKVIDNSDFIPIALDLAEETGIPLTKQTILKYESEIKRICRSMIKEQFVEPETKKVKAHITLYSDGTYEIEKPKIVQKDYPEYTMFAEGEDGLIVLKGIYKGKLVDEIDIAAGWQGAARGWSKHMLKMDKDLTEADREVFNKIISGRI